MHSEWNFKREKELYKRPNGVLLGVEI